MEDKQTPKELKIEDVDIKVLKSTAWDLGVEIEEKSWKIWIKEKKWSKKIYLKKRLEI